MRFTNDAQRRAVFAKITSFKDKAMLSKLSTVSDVKDQLADKKWQIDIKHDGIRAFAVKRGGAINLYNPRSGNNITKKFPEIISSLKPLLSDDGDSIIDGELVNISNGADKFTPVIGRFNQKDLTKSEILKTPITFIGFDMLEHWDKDITKKPLNRRIWHLNKAIGNGNKNVKIVKSTRKDKDKFQKDAMKNGFEGTILKNIESPYRIGKRSSDWIKLKRKNIKDLLAYGWDEGSGKNKGKVGSLLLRDSNGKSRGSVGSGLSDVERKRLSQKYPTGKITPPIPVEVEYLETGTKGGLRNPRLRYDLV